MEHKVAYLYPTWEVEDPMLKVIGNYTVSFSLSGGTLDTLEGSGKGGEERRERWREGGRERIYE